MFYLLILFNYVHYYHCSLLLAAMHYNENCTREVLLDEDGGERLQVQFAKWRKGKATCRPKRSPVTTREFGTLWMY